MCILTPDVCKGLPCSELAAVRWLATQCHDGNCELSSTHSLRGTVIPIVYVDIDLAKNVFDMHGVGAAGAVQLRQPKLARSKLNKVVAAVGFPASEPRYAERLQAQQMRGKRPANGILTLADGGGRYQAERIPCVGSRALVRCWAKRKFG